MASASGEEHQQQPPRASSGPAAKRAREWIVRRILRGLTDGPARYLTRRPEEMLINEVAVIQATTKKVTVALAYLSLTWSTVVLLGGFVSALKLVDFWFLTAISAAFAVNLADVFEYKKEFMLAAGRLHIVLRNHMASGSPSPGRCLVEIMKSSLAEACLGVSAIVFFIGFYILSVVPLGAIFLACGRLAANSYGDSGGDATNAVKLKASLQIFYSFALAQNVLFCFWCLLLFTRGTLSASVSKQCGFGKWGKSLVKRYLRETTAICATEGSVPQGRNLVTFAVTLLGSESLGDRRSGVRLLDTFVGKQISVGPDLLASKDGLENLMEVLEVGDGKTRVRAARVVGALAVAGDLRHIDHFSTALNYIASLLQASTDRFPAATCRGGTTTTTSMQEDDAGRNNKQWMYGACGPVYWCTLVFVHVFSTSDFMEDDQDDKLDCGGPKELVSQLVSQGMLIIESLALHQGNCVHICSNHGLLSRITAPLNSHAAFLHDAAEYDTEWTDILSRSLRIVARLISAPGETCRELRNRISSKTQAAAANLTRILEGDKFGPVLKAAAIEILAELASPKPAVTGSAAEPAVTGSAAEPPAVTGSAAEPAVTGSAAEPAVTGSAAEPPAVTGSAAEPAVTGSAAEPAVTDSAKHEINKFINRLWGIFRVAMDGNNTMEQDRDQQEANNRPVTTMHKAAGEALARMLAVRDDASFTSSDIQEMFTIQSSSSTVSAEVPAPAELLRHVVGQLTDIMVTNRGSRTMAAEILVRLCLHFPSHVKLPRQEVIKMFSNVLQLMIQHNPRPANNADARVFEKRPANNGTGVRANNTTNAAAAQNDVENPRPAPEDHTGNRPSSKGNEEQEHQQEEREFVVALLSLAVVVCDRMIDAQDFTCAEVPVLVRRLKEIIETNNDTTVECLSAVKLSCQLIVSMVRLNPSCIKVFMDHNFKDVLTKASKTLSNLDNWMLFDADYQVTKTEKPLASLVKQAQEHFDKAQELGNNGPA